MLWWWWTTLWAVLDCPRKEKDERALCLPRLVEHVLSPAEAAEIIAATEHAAASAGGFTSSRHAHAPTRDLPVATVYASGGASAAAAEAAVRKAANATASDAVARCGAERPVLVDGFVIRYSEEQTSLAQHGDGGRWSSTVALNPPRRRGVFVPPYATLPPQTCARRAGDLQGKGKDPTATCVDPNAFPDRRFAQERFSFEHPLHEYDGCARSPCLCPPTCMGETCDALVAIYNHSAASLEAAGCDCALCASVAALGAPRAGDDFFDGGGARFSSLRDATFFPDVGEAVVHGARLKHGADAVAGGAPRYVLAFFYDEAKCRDADADFDAFATSLVVGAIVPVLVYVVVAL